MKNLVRACHGAKSEAKAGPRLYGWLDRERRDVLKNSKIADNTDGSLPALWKMVVSAYSVGE
ncbi:MAG: hypothetical protein E4G96_03920 [Chrysiogenales bacterium]|nr:MAG: hypothetical protein E4G96_03920 [Chrysiogenales bacterium]